MGYPGWICLFGGLFLVFLNFNPSLGLESNSAPQFTIFSIPPVDTVMESSGGGGGEAAIFPDVDEDSDSIEHSNIPNPINVEIQVHDVKSGGGHPDNLTPTTTQRPSFAGIREKIGMQTSESSPSENSGFVVNFRGRSGVVVPKNGGTHLPPRQKTMRDGHITWDQAYDSSVKRAVVRSGSNVGVVPHNRNIVQIRPIVPKVAAPPTEDKARIVNVPSISSTSPSPPPHEQVAKMARFIVRNSNWTSLATISSRSPITGFPFANIFSVSDGTPHNSSGVPYMYMTPLDVTVQDLKKNVKSSLTMSLAQGAYCKSHGFDPEDPRCAHVILTGSIVELTNGTSEFDFAMEALFSRHPDMSSWPKDHGWFFAKLKIANILVLDYFGGAKTVEVEDYFAAQE